MTWTLLDEMPIERPILLSSKRADSPLLYLSKIRSQTTNNYITKSAVRSSIKLILKQIFRRSYFTTVILFLSIAATATTASLHEFIIRDGKRDDAAGEFIQCPTWQPFKCPNGDCIPIKYLCDGSPDCSDEYDENKSMCTAAIRPPVEETASFLRALMHAHGNDFLVKVFGPKAKDALEHMGGIEHVAIALSESPTIETFAESMDLGEAELMLMVAVLESIISGDPRSELSANEAADFRFFVQKLQETGFF